MTRVYIRLANQYFSKNANCKIPGGYMYYIDHPDHRVWNYICADWESKGTAAFLVSEVCQEECLPEFELVFVKETIGDYQ